jgi:hypothetical protein
MTSEQLTEQLGTTAVTYVEEIIVNDALTEPKRTLDKSVKFSPYMETRVLEGAPVGSKVVTLGGDTNETISVSPIDFISGR